MVRDDEYLKDDAFGKTTEEMDIPVNNDPEFVYSIDEEIFHEDFDDVMDMVNDDRDNEPGDRVVIYKGTPVRLTHMDFLKNISIVDILQNAAYDEDGEMAEDYMMDVSEEDEEKMILEINEIICKYALPPAYFRVTDIIPMTVVVDGIEE